MRILFIAPQVPYPPLRGYQLRAWHQLRLLSARHRITLVCYADERRDSDAIQKVRNYCEEVITLPYRAHRSIAAMGMGVLQGLPLQARIYQLPEMRDAIAHLLGESRHELVHVQLARMAGLLANPTPIPRVIDFIDALSLNLRRRGNFDRKPLRTIARIEARRLIHYEREICRSWNHATVVSAIDRAAIGDFPNLTVNPSGVDRDEFTFQSEPRNRREILFTGNLGYFSNVDAIGWFAREIFPRIVSVDPAAQLTIVGARPSREVRALAQLDRRITVTGWVEKLTPFLHRCAVAIAPMRAGSGQQFKLLEAMAAGAPMVTTSIAAEATAARSGRHLMVADTPEDFAGAVLRLMRDETMASRIAKEARALVESEYRWERSVGDLEAIYSSVVEKSARQ